MARSYCFDDPYTGGRAKLDDVDRALCEDTKYPYSADTFCPRYDTLVTLGFAILMWASRTGYKSGACVVTEAMIRAYRDYYKDDPTYANIDPLMPQLLDYLGGRRYVFSAWG